MNAWVLHGIGDLRCEEVPEPELLPGEVSVRVRCAGICSSDVPRIFTTGTYKYPLIAGHEFSGEVQSGRRVTAFPLLPCFDCKQCREGRYETCLNYGYIGSRRDGAFAAYVAVPEWNLIDIPDDMSFETAAMIEPAAVALHAVKMADLSGVSSAAVIGDGIIGTLAARWMAVAGNCSTHLFGRGVKPSYAENDENLCANGKESRSGSYDLCFEAVGSTEAIRRCIDLVRPNGQLILIGNPEASLRLERDLYWQILRKQITVRGTWNSGFPSDWQQVIENAGRLFTGNAANLISHRFHFSRLNEALEMMRGKKEKYKKVMIVL